MVLLYKDKSMLKNIKQFIINLYQILRYGYADEDLYSLDYTVSKFILPRLKAFRKNVGCHPGNMTLKQWKKRLDKMIYAFELGLLTGDGEILTDKEYKKMNEGLHIFADDFNSLWT